MLQGSGENGKSAITTDGLVPALGDYASMASTKLFQSSSSEHSTERAELRGKRLVIAEELTEGKSINIKGRGVGRHSVTQLGRPRCFTSSSRLCCCRVPGRRTPTGWRWHRADSRQP